MPNTNIPVEQLIEQLHSSDWIARCDAARLLGQSRDPRAVNALLPDLEDSDWRVRRNAAQALGALRDPRAVEPLIRMLKDRTATVRERAIVALGRIKHAQALPALLDALINDKHAAYKAQQSIKKFGKKALPAVLEACEKHPHPGLITLLVEMKYAGAVDFLLPLLDAPDRTTRSMSIRELGKLGNKKAIPPLLERLKSSDLFMQAEIVAALGDLGAGEAIPSMLDLLQDHELFGQRSGLYHAITEAFQKIAGLTKKIESLFPGRYLSFNMGGASLGLPEVSNLWGNNMFQMLKDKFPQTEQHQDEIAKQTGLPPDLIRKAVDDTMWKFGVMFADARDASQERTKYLVELLASDSTVERAAAALSLPWYMNKQCIEPLAQATADKEEVVRKTATWACEALQTALRYRGPAR